MLNMKFEHLVKKHKKLQKKFVITKNHNICNTEPNQNQYKCFATSYSFHHCDKKHHKFKTEEITGKNIEHF